MPPETPPHVRPARAGDLAAIGAIQVSAWTAGYAGLVPAEVLSALNPEALAEQWRAAVSTPPSPRHVVLVAVDQGVVTGFAACDDQGEIVALEVDPTHVRHGHGSRLLAALADHGREQGLERLSYWCPLGDEARRTFLDQAGFGPSGGVRDLSDAAGATVREAELVAALSSE